MWNFIKGIFGAGDKGSDNVMKIASGVGGWIDGQQYTEQEKAEFNAKMIGVYSDYMASTASENTERSITRRVIALWVIRTEVFLLIASIALFKLDPAWSEYIYKVATNDPMNFLVLGVGAFFFGAHLVRATQGK